MLISCHVVPGPTVSGFATCPANRSQTYSLRASVKPISKSSGSYQPQALPCLLGQAIRPPNCISGPKHGSIKLTLRPVAATGSVNACRLFTPEPDRAAALASRRPMAASPLSPCVQAKNIATFLADRERYVCMYTYMCRYVCMYTYIRIHARIQTHTYIYIYILYNIQAYS